MPSCVRGKIPVHSFAGWWFRCILVCGVGFRCIYLGSDDFGGFMCEGKESVAFTWGMTLSVHSCVRRRNFGAFTLGMTISVHSFVRGKIPVHLLEGWRFRCIHLWGAGFWCIYLRSDDVGAFFWCMHVMGVRFRCIYLRDDDFGAFMSEG